MNKIKKSYEQIQTVISERTCKWNFLVSKKKRKRKRKKKKRKEKKQVPHAMSHHNNGYKVYNCLNSSLKVSAIIINTDVKGSLHVSLTGSQFQRYNTTACFFFLYKLRQNVP